MAVDFNSSETKQNLMRSFAGESMAANRYRFAAEEAKKQKLYVVEAVFRFTEKQEMAHAKVFYDLMKEGGSGSIGITGGYPLSLSTDIAALLRDAKHNELEEYETVYRSFGEKAKEEGFEKAAALYGMIAEIEKTHAGRFEKLAELLEQNKLFVSEAECKWMCLNCGHVFEGRGAPEICPVCQHDRGYFIRLELAPYTSLS